MEIKIKGYEKCTGAITSFKGAWQALSNFAPCAVHDENGKSYPTVEHYFQAMKCAYPADRDIIRNAKTPGDAKRLGRRVKMRPDWDDAKPQIILDTLREKFSPSHPLNKEAMETLMRTGTALLIEGNTWGDREWGASTLNGGAVTGRNLLGQLLMHVREEILKGKQLPFQECGAGRDTVWLIGD